LAGNNTVGLYEMMEWQGEYEPGSVNPYSTNIQALFRSDYGKRYRIDGFYAGENTFKVRFMPTSLGRWRYNVRINNKLVAEVSFICVPSSLKGPLKQDEEYPNHFQYENGESYYMLGNTAYNSIAAYRCKREQFKDFLDYYAQRNFNWVRFHLQQVSWSTFDTVIWPWGGTPENPDYTVFNLETFHAAEAVIKELADRNMIASVILLHNDPPIEAMQERKVGICKEYIKHAVARLSSYWNVVWNVCNEWQRDFMFTYDEVDELGFYLHEIDPYDRLTSCHHYGRFEFYDKEWTDMSSMQERGQPDVVNRGIIINRSFGKIVINEEYGYEKDGFSPPNEPDDVRHDHWAIAMAGGYGCYGDKTKGPKISVYYTAILEDAKDTQAPDQLQYLPVFMRNTGYKRMITANPFIRKCNPAEVFCLAEPGQEYIVYMVIGQDVEVDLTHVRGSLAVNWFNPRNGETVSADSVSIAQSIEEFQEQGMQDPNWRRVRRVYSYRQFTPPDYVNDWVLHLLKVD
jgi:hypothetical protein